MAVAGKKYRVSASPREGFIDRRRAGEAWPRGAGKFREVFVLDAAEDPPGRKLEDGTFAIGQKTFDILKKDPEIFIDGAERGAEAEDTAALVARAEKAEARVKELEAEVAALEEDLAEATKPKG